MERVASGALAAATRIAGGATITGIAPDALASALDRVRSGCCGRLAEPRLPGRAHSRGLPRGAGEARPDARRAGLIRVSMDKAGNGIGRAFDGRLDPSIRGQAGDGLARALGGRHSGRMLVFTSGGGTLARLAAAEAAAYVDAPVRALEGGNAAWARGGGIR